MKKSISPVSSRIAHGAGGLFLSMVLPSTKSETKRFVTIASLRVNHVAIVAISAKKEE